MNDFFLIAILFLGGIGGYAIRTLVSQVKQKSIDLDIKNKELTAREHARSILEKAEARAEELRNEYKSKEEYLLKKEALIDARQKDVETENHRLKNLDTAYYKKTEELKEKEASITTEIERIAGMSADDVKTMLEERIEKQYATDLLVRIRKLEEYARETLGNRAREIIVDTIERMASSVVQEVTTTTISIPNDEVKGKIIGKEGRNIRSFERAAGVEIIIDDTPGSIVISSFDPIRRQVARVALENLILDGRIQPAKIEEFIENAQANINKITKEKGEWAVHELGIYNLDPRIVGILGRLWFRTSYGQNVLQHSVEMARMAAMMAEELGADVMIAKAGALVHDIGKALDHEITGTHIEIGIRLLRKFGADERIIDAMKSHHGDYPHASIESVIVTSVDALSGGRPGARRDTLENYLKRLGELEEIANRFPGVEKSYALSAGREIRVFVHPHHINDMQAHALAREIVESIEQELKYPGEIKVTVIREERIIEFAR